MAHLVQLKGKDRSEAKRKIRTTNSGRSIKTPLKILTSEEDEPLRKKPSVQMGLELQKLRDLAAKRGLSSAQNSTQSKKATKTTHVQIHQELTSEQISMATKCVPNAIEKTSASNKNNSSQSKFGDSSAKQSSHASSSSQLDDFIITDPFSTITEEPILVANDLANEIASIIEKKSKVNLETIEERLG
ncbi:uncharacterized protein LOC127278539 [Leptopilina boulardi]|uniref:uncharacterized protein LOC127278539 n=1 Tax=Leptopilina boulardi TaxID=63433 RepID=UPI0021F52ED2|nr:uncharacterized protein LOC127278539 [Leptopilina boulardi]